MREDDQTYRDAIDRIDPKSELGEFLAKSKDGKLPADKIKKPATWKALDSEIKEKGVFDYWPHMAAAVAIIAIGIYFILPNKVETVQYNAQLSETKQISLPDESHVILSAGSSLEAQYSNDARAPIAATK